MREVYKSASYKPELVTGRYVRVSGRKGAYTFRVFETSTGTGHFAGKRGYGPTLLEYDCDGSELPDELKARCIASKKTEKWD